MDDGDLEMLFQPRRLAGHKNLLLTLGVGAMAITIAACGSTAVDGDPSPGGQDDNDPLLGAPAGFGGSGTLPPVSAAQLDESGMDQGSTSGGFAGETVVSILPVDDRMGCETGGPDHPPLFTEGEPPTNEPVPGDMIFELDPDNLMVDDDVTGRNVEDGISLGMPVPGLADVPEMIAEPVETSPEPVEPPAIMPIHEETLPELIAIPVDSCGEAPDPTVSVGTSDSRGTTIEPLPQPGLELPANVMIVEAPIEAAAVVVAESFPPQYFLSVESGLPNAATTFGDYAVKRDGNLVSVSITNYVQTDVMSAQVYGIRETNIALGSEFVSGQAYEVLINGNSWARFTAQ